MTDATMREKSLEEAYFQLEADYARFRREVRGALGKPSNLGVSDRWIVSEIDTLRAIAEQLAEALEELEWPGDISAAVTGKAIVECPSCETFYGKGHRDGCQLAAALAAWKGWNRES